MSKDGFTAELIESGESLKRGYTALIGNIGRIVAFITLTVCALVVFTDVSFYDIGTKSVTSGTLILLIGSYLMYFSLEDAGERLGEESDVFKEASARFSAAVSQVRPESIGALRDFCARYSAQELEFRRASRIMAAGASTEEYLAFKRGELTERKMRRALKRADTVRPVPLTPEMLLERDRTKSKCELADPERTKALRLAVRLIPSTLCTLFTASIMLSAKDGLSAISVIEGLLKLCALPIIGFRGYSAGYLYAKNTRRAWIDTKSRILEAFAAEQEGVGQTDRSHISGAPKHSG